MRQNKVKRILREGGVALGTMVFEFATTGIGRLTAEAAANFVIYDQEHTGYTLETIRMLMATSRSADIVPMLRVPSTQYHLLSGPLDVGAMGIMVPMVNTEEQARSIVRYAKYPPLGRRGAAFGFAHDDYAGGDVAEKIRSADAEGMLIAQIETAEGVANADRIAAVEGIDVLWVGHFDLTLDMAIPAQFDHPEYRRAIERVVEACHKHGKAAGFMAASVEDAQALIAQGFRILAYSGDMFIYRDRLAHGLQAIRRGLTS